MTNFEVVLRRTIDRLTDGTPAGRERVYRASRRALDQLNASGKDPAAADDQRSLLEGAIARLEADYGYRQHGPRKSLAASGTEPLTGDVAAEQDYEIVAPASQNAASETGAEIGSTAADQHTVLYPVGSGSDEPAEPDTARETVPSSARDTKEPAAVSTSVALLARPELTLGGVSGSVTIDLTAEHASAALPIRTPRQTAWSEELHIRFADFGATPVDIRSLRTAGEGTASNLLVREPAESQPPGSGSNIDADFGSGALTPVTRAVSDEVVAAAFPGSAALRDKPGPAAISPAPERTIDGPLSEKPQPALSAEPRAGVPDRDAVLAPVHSMPSVSEVPSSIPPMLAPSGPRARTGDRESASYAGDWDDRAVAPVAGAAGDEADVASLSETASSDQAGPPAAEPMPQPMIGAIEGIPSQRSEGPKPIAGMPNLIAAWADLRSVLATDEETASTVPAPERIEPQAPTAGRELSNYGDGSDDRSAIVIAATDASRVSLKRVALPEQDADPAEGASADLVPDDNLFSDDLFAEPAELLDSEIDSPMDGLDTELETEGDERVKEPPTAQSPVPQAASTSPHAEIEPGIVSEAAAEVDGDWIEAEPPADDEWPDVANALPESPCAEARPTSDEAPFRNNAALASLSDEPPITGAHGNDFESAGATEPSRSSKVISISPASSLQREPLLGPRLPSEAIDSSRASQDPPYGAEQPTSADALTSPIAFGPGEDPEQDFDWHRGDTSLQLVLAHQAERLSELAAGSKMSSSARRFGVSSGEIEPVSALGASRSSGLSASVLEPDTEATFEERRRTDPDGLNDNLANLEPATSAGGERAADRAALPPIVSNIGSQQEMDSGTVQTADGSLMAHIRDGLSKGLVPLDGAWVTSEERESSLVKNQMRARSLTFQATLAIVAIALFACLIWLMLLAIAY